MAQVSIVAHWPIVKYQEFQALLLNHNFHSQFMMQCTIFDMISYAVWDIFLPLFYFTLVVI